MAYTTIDDPTAHFQVATYTGNGSSQNITNDGNSDLQPDLLWTKERTNSSTDHVVANSSIGWDAPKGIGYPWEAANSPYGGQMSTNSTGAESTPAATYGYASAALTDGFTVSAGGTNADNCNKNNAEFVAWQWKANGGTTASNTTGSIDSVVQANQDAGFSIVTFTSASSGVFSVGHGLGVLPAMIIVKNREAASQWRVWHKDLTNLVTSVVSLNRTDAIENYSEFWGAGVTSSVFGSKTGMSVEASDTYLAYCFAEKQGYSKFGKYVGNGNVDGPMVYLGFKPAWILLKRTDSSSGGNWHIIDNKRSASGGANVNVYSIVANATDAESTGEAESTYGIDFLSNGFKIRASHVTRNASGGTYIYMCFAENPFISSTGTPTTAR